MKPKEKAIILNARDNVATALTDLDTGDKLLTVKLTSAVPFGHKFSLAHLESGAPVIKYGEVIGTATSAINKGDYVHVHNVASTRGQSKPAGGAK